VKCWITPGTMISWVIEKAAVTVTVVQEVIVDIENIPGQSEDWMDTTKPCQVVTYLRLLFSVCMPLLLALAILCIYIRFEYLAFVHMY